MYIYTFAIYKDNRLVSAFGGTIDLKEGYKTIAKLMLKGHKDSKVLVFRDFENIDSISI